MKKILFIVLSAVIVVTAGSLVYSFSNLFSGTPNADLNETKSIEADKVTDITAAMDIGDILIRESPDDSIHVELQGDLSKRQAKKLNFELEENGGTLTAEVIHDNELFSIFSLLGFDSITKGEVKLEIQLPDKEFSNIHIASNVGDIRVDKAAGAFDIKTEVGDVRLDEVAGAFDIETGVGDIRIDTDTINKDVAVHSNVGDVEFIVRNVPKDVTIDLQTEVGDARTEKIDGMEEATGMQIIQELGHGGPKLEIATEVGEINVKRQ